MRESFFIALLIFTAMFSLENANGEQIDFGFALGYDRMTEHGDAQGINGRLTVNYVSAGLDFRARSNEHIEVGAIANIAIPTSGTLNVNGSQQQFDSSDFDSAFSLNSAGLISRYNEIAHGHAWTLGGGFHTRFRGMLIQNVGVISIGFGPTLAASLRLSAGQAGVIRIGIEPFYSVFGLMRTDVSGVVSEEWSRLNQRGVNIRASLGLTNSGD